MFKPLWSCSFREKHNSHAGTTKAGRVTDGSLGHGVHLPAENESWSLTLPGGSSSSRLEADWRESVCGCHELWQLRLAGHANLHLTPEHMSGWGLFPLGVFPFCYPDPSTCLSQIVLSFTLHLPAHPFFSHPSSFPFSLLPSNSPEPFNMQSFIQTIMLTLESILWVICVPGRIQKPSHPRRLSSSVTFEKVVRQLLPGHTHVLTPATSSSSNCLNSVSVFSPSPTLVLCHSAPLQALWIPVFHFYQHFCPQLSSLAAQWLHSVLPPSTVPPVMHAHAAASQTWMFNLVTWECCRYWQTGEKVHYTPSFDCFIYYSSLLDISVSMTASHQLGF